jgi:peptidyl-prolyl cis-trans isomerase A (cyclophilin A)
MLRVLVIGIALLAAVLARADDASIGDQPELDFGGKRNPDGQGFAAFGRVVKGMDVVKKIQQAPADGQTLKPPVKIVRVSRL